MAQQTPAQREQVRQLQPGAVASWWAARAPGLGDLPGRQRAVYEHWGPGECQRHQRADCGASANGM